MKKTMMLLWLFPVFGLAGGEMKIPARWQPPKMIAGRDYRVGLFPRNYVIEDPVMMAMPLHRDAIWNIRRTSSHKIDFIGKILQKPESHSGTALFKTTNPLLLHTTCYYTEKEKDVAIPDSSFQSLKKAAGNRAEELIAAYPECPAADALRSVLSLAEPEILDPGLKEKLHQKLSEMLKPSSHRAVYGRE